MNCFQKLLSSWWRTTQSTSLHHPERLWIAFKNYYLRDEGQLFWTKPAEPLSCELLSKIIIFVMKDNIRLTLQFPHIVVNCFQKLLSSWWRTTWNQKIQNPILLWIAFKNYYLRDEGQLNLLRTEWHLRCELLSKIIIFVMKDNLAFLVKKCLVVVNCFQKLLSSWWRTTSVFYTFFSYMLWIAFKNYYLRDEGQL